MAEEFMNETEMDEEFEERSGNVKEQVSRVAETLGDLTREVVKLQLSLATLPFRALPLDTRRHSRAAMVETFRAMRSMVDEAADRLEDALEGAEKAMAGSEGEEIIIEGEEEEGEGEV